MSPTFRRVGGRVEADVAVLGAGPAGLALARHLQASGLRVLVAEPGLVGEGAAASGPGVALPALAEHYATLCRDLGRSVARAWWELAVEGAAALRRHVPPGARKGGVMLLPANEAEYREMVESLPLLAEDGFQPRMMGAAAATNYLPVEADPGVMYLPGGVVFDPGAASRSQAEGLAAGGVPVFESSPLRGMTVESEGVACEFDEGEARVEVVVVAEGCPLEPVPGSPARWLFPLRGQSMSTAPVRAGMTGVTVAAAANRGHEVYRETPDGGMLASGINPGSGPREQTEDLEVDETFQGFLEGFLHQRFPESRRVEVSRRWASSYHFTPDGLPLVGSLPGSTRVHMLVGFGASPWSLAVGAGLRLARVLAGEAATLPEGSSPRRFL